MGRPSFVRILVPMVATAAIVAGLTTTAAATTTTPRAAATSTSPVLTHAQFVQRLDAICAKANREAAPISKAYTAALNANDPAKAGAILARRAPLYHRWIGQIESLSPPAADQAAFARYKLQTQRIQGLLERVATALRAEDVAQAARLAPLVVTAGRVRKSAAVALGAKDCGT